MARYWCTQGTESGRLAAHWGRFAPFWAHSSLRAHVQHVLAHNLQFRQRKQRYQIGRVFGQSFVFDPGIAELALDDSKQVLYLGADAGLGVFELLQDGAYGRGLVHGTSLTRHQGDVPVHFGVLGLDLFALVHTPVARVGKDIGLLTVQQRVGLSDVVRVGRGGGHAVRQARVGVDADVALHPEVPLVAFFCLVHLGVARAADVLGGVGGGNQRGVHHRVGFEQHALGCQVGVDGGQNLRAQVLSFEQVAKPKDGALNRQGGFRPYPDRQTRETWACRTEPLP